jgi:hypothetical protein
MMQSCASAAKLLGGGPILETGVQHHGLLRVTATSDRHRILTMVCCQAPTACFVRVLTSRCSQNDTSRNLAGRN